MVGSTFIYSSTTQITLHPVLLDMFGFDEDISQFINSESVKKRDLMKVNKLPLNAKQTQFMFLSTIKMVEITMLEGDRI